MIGKMDSRVQFQRATLSNDGFSDVESWQNLGDPRWAKKTDIADKEGLRSGELQATVTSTFRIRWSNSLRDLNAKDRLIFDNVIFPIFGVREVQRRRFMVITAGARVDE